MRTRSAGDEERRLRSRSKAMERETAILVERIVRAQTEVAVAAYEEQIAKLQLEKATVEEKADKLTSPGRSFDEMFELAMRFLASPYEIWKDGGTAVKRTVLRLVYARRLECDREMGVRTPVSTFPFKVLHFLRTSDCKVVPQDGLEPPTTYLRNRCSTN